MFGGGEDVGHPGGLRAAFPAAENGTDDKYYKKYHAILRRCAGVQKENEMLVNRVYLVKKMVRRLRRERKFLMEELDRRGDNYRSLPLTIAIEEDEKSFALPQTSSLPALGRPRSSGSSLNARRQLQVKRERVERDTSTPKRPNNAFLQFCQEQREAAVAHHLNQTGRTPDKKQLTRQLASRWNALSEEDKKIYVEKYEREKERQSEERKQRQQDT
ncbi:uncharacterized protein LOC127000707 isoform X1 [Eriocheir sinensis]|uniref:uncharacterized protein LOC127000707 isoform X1 n=1 Tax=Eriocheir sinensis TaxID=95602 RepID=UPI0021C76AB6|nr:uncharacterized protein LOC127000707 isoform X1 [Eriocheir sinensis]